MEPKESNGAFDIGATGVDVKLTYTAAAAGASKWKNIVEIT